MACRKFGLGEFDRKINPGEANFYFSAYDMALMYNCKLFKSSINSLCNCTFDHIEIIKKVLKNFILDPSVLDSMLFNGDDDFFQTCIRGAYFGFKDRNGKIQSDKIFFGFSPELLCREVVYKKVAIEYYLYGVAVKKDFVNVDLLCQNNVNFCEDGDGWIYFPIRNLSLDSGGVAPYDGASCVADNFELERNLDICHSLITLHKMEVLISIAGPKIIEKLNEDNSLLEFKLGRSYNYVYPDSIKKIYCGDFIYISGFPDSFYFGLSPNVFDEVDELTGEAGKQKTKNPKDIIVSDYFSSVCMVVVGDESPDEKYINNGVEFAGNWVYFPVCRKLLCCDNFLDLYVKRIVKLIKQGVAAYWKK